MVATTALLARDSARSWDCDGANAPHCERLLRIKTEQVRAPSRAPRCLTRECNQPQVASRAPNGIHWAFDCITASRISELQRLALGTSYPVGSWRCRRSFAPSQYESLSLLVRLALSPSVGLALALSVGLGLSLSVGLALSLSFSRTRRPQSCSSICFSSCHLHFRPKT